MEASDTKAAADMEMSAQACDDAATDVSSRGPLTVNETFCCADRQLRETGRRHEGSRGADHLHCLILSCGTLAHSKLWCTGSKLWCTGSFQAVVPHSKLWCIASF